MRFLANRCETAHDLGKKPSTEMLAKQPQSTKVSGLIDTKALVKLKTLRLQPIFVTYRPKIFQLVRLSRDSETSLMKHTFPPSKL